MWLAEHQENKKFYDKFGSRPDALPLRASGHIVHGNACRLDWNTVCPHMAEEEVYVMGNPPYLGARLQEDAHKSDMHCAIADNLAYNNLDYIAAWFYKGAQYIKNSNAQLAFVSTNSICQGEQVPLLWRFIQNQNIEIGFAYPSFKWSNNAKYNAGVTCAIIGLRNRCNREKYFYSNENRAIVSNINAYLLDSANVIVDKQSRAISNLPEVNFGSMPNDGGNLLLSESEKDGLLNMHPGHLH